MPASARWASPEVGHLGRGAAGDEDVVGLEVPVTMPRSWACWTPAGRLLQEPARREPAGSLRAAAERAALDELHDEEQLRCRSEPHVVAP